MTKKTLILSLAAIAVLSLSAMAMAGPGFGGCPGWGGGYGQASQALTPEQQEKAQDLYDAYQKAVIPLREQVLAKHALLNAALAADKPDADTVEALTKDLGELKTKLLTERVELRKKLAEAGIQGGFGYGRGMGRGYGYGSGPCGGGAACPGAQNTPCPGGGPCGGQGPCGGACQGYGG